MLNKRKQSALSHDNSLKGILQKKEIKSNHQTDPSDEYNIKRVSPSNGLPIRSIKQSKKVKPEFLLYQRMQEKLQNIEQKIQQLKANMQKRKIERMKKTQQRNKQINKQIKKRNPEAKKDEKLNENLNEKAKLIQSKEPEKKVIEDQIIESKNIEIKENSEKKQKDNKKQMDLNQFVSNQKPNLKQALSINSLVTSMPESKGHTFDINPYSPRSSVYYVSQAVKGYKDKGSLVYQHLKTSIHLFNYFSQYRMPLNSEVQKRALNLPIKPGYQGKKTILFDLDETLIHCTQNLHEKHEIELPILFPNGTKIIAGLNIRPGAIAILQSLYQNFELIIFTASHNCYANVVIDYLDPQKKYIQHRLYREHCHLTANGEYIKDLRILNRQFKNMVLVDNAAYSYAFQPENGIPIIPYYHGQKDYELKMLCVYLQKLLFVGDVRLENRKTFKLNRYRDYKHSQVQELVQNLYINKHQQQN